MLKIAVVGCGQIAEDHVREIRKIEGTQIVAVCDIEELMAEQLADRYCIPKCYDDMEKLLSEMMPDVVHITTPPQSHLSLGERALQAGCHIYVEKPFTIDVKEADQLFAMAQKVGRKITVGHIYYFDPPAIIMREFISKAILGEPIHIESFYGYDLSGSFGYAILNNNNHWVHTLPGKLFQNNIDHLLNKITEFIPDENPEIYAMGYKLRSELLGDQRDQMLDELRVMMKGKRTTASAIFSSHIRPVGHFARIYGTKNTIHVDYVSRTVIIDQGPKYPSAIGRLLPAFGIGFQYFREGGKSVMRFARSDFHYFAGMNRLIRLFYQSILKDSPVPIPYREIRRITAISKEIFKQINQKG